MIRIEIPSALSAEDHEMIRKSKKRGIDIPALHKVMGYSPTRRTHRSRAVAILKNMRNQAEKGATEND